MKQSKKTILLLCFCMMLAASAFGQQVKQKENPQKPVASKSQTPDSRSTVEYVTRGSIPGLPFSAAVRVGQMLYLSGQLGSDSSDKVVSGGIEAETRQAMENIRAVLEKNGSSMDHVVKCTVMLADLKADYDSMNKVYRTFFSEGRFPARSTFGATALARNARVEIECWGTLK